MSRFRVTIDLDLPPARDADELRGWCAGLTGHIDRFVPVAVPLTPAGDSTPLTVTVDAPGRDDAVGEAFSRIDQALSDVRIPLDLTLVSVEPVRVLQIVERSVPVERPRPEFTLTSARSLAAEARERAEQARRLTAWMVSRRASQREIRGRLLAGRAYVAE